MTRTRRPDDSQAASPIAGRPARSLGLALTLGALALALSACGGPGYAYRSFYDEGGSGVSDDQFVYISRPGEPKTITLVDTRTGEPIWTMDVPVGNQLVINFEPDRNKDNPSRPDMMRWELMEDRTLHGRLSNAIPVPAFHSRRLDMAIRAIPEITN